MMNCFPVLYDGELLYSAICRYRRMAGIVNRRALMNDLYSKRIEMNNIYFPLHCERFVSNLPVTSKITTDKIIKEHSLFRVVSSFLNEERTSLIYEGINQSERFKLYTKLGLSSSKIKLRDSLFFCPECLKEDLHKYGESYWRTLHQVIGVFYCEKHMRPLLKTRNYYNNSIIDFICADDIDVKSCKPAIENVDFTNINLKYIEMIKYLLSHDVPRRKQNYFNDFFIDKLREKGYASGNGSIYMKEFQKDFIQYYSNEYLKLMQSEVLGAENWLSKFIRYSGKQKHFLRYILIIQFLDVDIADVFTAQNVVGKKKCDIIPNPKYDRDVQRERWLNVLQENPGLCKSEYKKIGKGLYSWLYRNDNEWFEKITPKKR